MRSSTWEYRSAGCDVLIDAFNIEHPIQGTSSLCCSNGIVQLPPLIKPPNSMVKLFSEATAQAASFRQHIRQFNGSLAMASMSCEHKVFRTGPPVVVVGGEVKHFIGSPQPGAQISPQYLATYVYDPDHEHQLQSRLDHIHDHMQSANAARCVHRRDRYWCKECDGSGVRTLRYLQAVMHESNPHVHRFLYAMAKAQEVCESEGCELKDVQLLLDADSHRHHSGTINRPTSTEIAVLSPNHSAHPQQQSSRHVRLNLASGGVQHINETHPIYDPLKYPIMFPYGDFGWGLGMRFRNSNRKGNITCRLYYAYRITWRNPSKHFNTLHYSSKPFQEYMCDHYAMKTQLDLNYQRNNQKKLRADTYAGLTDAIANNDGSNAGKRVILPSSFLGGERDMHQQYQNGMALHREFGIASLFLTMTCNPASPCVQAAIPPGFTANDRPDIVARVFRQQVKHLMKLITEHGYYGRRVAHMYVIEFQKRGLPHIHLLLILDQQHRILPHEVDEIVSAEVPPVSQPVRREKVTTKMVHGPCGAHNPNARCMVDGKCVEGFPKEFNQTSRFRDGKYYAEYRRRECDEEGNKITFQVDRRGAWCNECQSSTCTLDNRWIVPHPADCIFMLMDCHLNLQVGNCSSCMFVSASNAH